MDPSQDNQSAAAKNADQPNQKKYSRDKAKKTRSRQPGEMQQHPGAGYQNIVDNDNETTVEEMQ
jgi:hypothetical protein